MRVFVSSTCHDLIDARAELEGSLREMGLTPLLSDRPSSEFEVSPDANSIETCLAGVRSAEVFLCVLSQRYGPSLKAAGYPDVSATHLEWTEARKVGKPIRMYVRDRLEGEYAIWKRNPKTVRFAWVRDAHDHPIFEFLDQHRMLVANEPQSNWFWPFRDSIDLKRRVESDLKYISSRALLTKWLQEGRLPNLRAHLHARHGGGPSQDATFVVSFAVRGSSPVLDPRLHVEKGDAGQALEDITTGREASARIQCRMPPGGRFEREIALQYVTDFGAVIEDIFALSCNVGATEAGAVEMKRKRLVRGLGIELE